MITCNLRGARRILCLGAHSDDIEIGCGGTILRLLETSEAMVRSAIAEWPDGQFEAERFVDDDGVDLEQAVRIHVAVTKSGFGSAWAGPWSSSTKPVQPTTGPAKPPKAEPAKG